VRGQRKDMGRGLFFLSTPFPPLCHSHPPSPCLRDWARRIWAEVSVFPACGRATLIILFLFT
jgi:hypothetical protein